MAKAKNPNNNPGKLILGIALIMLGLILMTGRIKPTPVVSSSFESEPVKIEGFMENELKDEELPVKMIISELGVDLQIKKANLINGYWEVFEDSAGWGEGTGIPGKKGNQVIFAHAREGLFKPLKKIKTGIRVYVLTDKSWYTYEVIEIKEVTPRETSVIAPTEEETLTLYTCSGFRDSKRLIVRAKRV